jgi:hypothetical protein
MQPNELRTGILNMKMMKQLGTRALVWMTMSILLCGATSLRAEDDEPGPFQRLFRALRHAGHESKHKSEHRTTRKQTSESSDYSSNGVESSNRSTGGGSVSKPPSERNTRAGTKATSKKGEDLRYGTPVPGKPGLVTSPYSPNSGYIDVRGFAPGTPVKDPYTGKIFLTP